MAIHSSQYRSEQFIVTINLILIYADAAGPAGEVLWGRSLGSADIAHTV